MDEHSPGFTQDIAAVFAARDRACCRWVIRWKDVDRNDATLHGVDVITVRDGKIAENLRHDVDDRGRRVAAPHPTNGAKDAHGNHLS